MRLILIVCILLPLFGCNKKKAIINTIPDEEMNQPQKWIEEDVAPDIKVTTPPVSNAEPVGHPPDVDPVTIYFDFDRAVIRADQIPFLDIFTAEANRSPSRPLVIEGYCCPIGTDIYNYRLGLRRGQAICSYLSQYIENSMEISSFGESVCVDFRPEFYWKSRRVVIKFEE